MGRCPRCGAGRLLHGFLKSVVHCRACHQDWSRQRADDFPPYIALLIGGHLLAPVMIALGSNETLPLELLIAIGVGLGISLVLSLLRPLKGAVIALQWWNGMHGFDPPGRGLSESSCVGGDNGQEGDPPYPDTHHILTQGAGDSG